MRSMGELSIEIQNRIEEAIEAVNNATSEVHRVGGKLHDARVRLRKTTNAANKRLKDAYSRSWGAIEKARPYHKARVSEEEAREELKNISGQFRRVNRQLSSAKESAALAEQVLLLAQGNQSKAVLLTDGQDLLNDATAQVYSAQKEVAKIEAIHRKKCEELQITEIHTKQLANKLKKWIDKSNSYFELKATLQRQIQLEQNEIREFERYVLLAKRKYAEAFTELDKLSRSLASCEDATPTPNNSSSPSESVTPEDATPTTDNSSSPSQSFVSEVQRSDPTKVTDVTPEVEITIRTFPQPADAKESEDQSQVRNYDNEDQSQIRHYEDQSQIKNYDTGRPETYISLQGGYEGSYS